MRLSVPDHIRALAPYIPGKPPEELEREMGIKNAVKLASNENPLGPSPKALRAIKRALSGINRYPDGACYYLKDALANKLGFKSENIILGNGSNEIITNVAKAFLRPGEEAVVAHPAFIIYQTAVQCAGAVKIRTPLKNFTHDLQAMKSRITGKTRLIFISNPNNPTGTMVGAQEFDLFMAGLPDDIIVVLDEAYHEYVERDDPPDTVSYVREGKGLIVLRTFSKVFGLAALRIGYGIADASIIEILERVRDPFNVNTLAQVAALASLDDDEHVRRSADINAKGKAYLYKKLDEMGIDYVQSQANFILVKVGDGKKVYHDLLKQGVIVRPLGSYDLAEHVRVTIGLPAENKNFIDALRKVMKGS